MKQSFCGKQRRQRGWNDFSTSSYYTRSGRTVKLNFETRKSQMTFLLSTMYPSALVIISLPTPTFHCMFTWLPLLLCTSCAGGTKSERQRHPEQVQPCTDCPFTSEISVKREHGILILVMRYFYCFFRDSCVGPSFTPLLLGKGKNWPIAKRRVPRSHPRNNCGTHFGSSSLLFSKVANAGL